MGIELYCLSSPERSSESFFSPQATLGGLSWFNVPVRLDRETGIHPPERSLDQRIEDSREWLDDLAIVEGLPEVSLNEDLSMVFEVGGDSSGASYYVSGKTRKCYVWWHDPDAIELVCTSPTEFLDWMIETQPEHPKGCSWATFEECSWEVALYHVPLAHAERYPIARFCERVKELGAFEVEHLASGSAHLLRPRRGQLVAMAHDLRGFRTSLDVQVSSRIELDQLERDQWVGFVEWLKAEGFCHPDTPSVRNLDGDAPDDTW